jgi:uncharacterized small protein (DUF1192 family)
MERDSLRAEIARLRAALNEETRAARTLRYDEVATLQAENERLRAALKHFRGLALANGVTLGEIADRIDRD